METKTPIIKTPPVRIFLQTGMEEWEDSTDWTDVCETEVSWCSDRINESDIEYVLASDHAASLRECEEEKDKFKKALEHYADMEMWDESFNGLGKQSGFADRYIGFERGTEWDNGYDLARSVLGEEN